MDTYNLFISHSWCYADSYERLNLLLKAHPSFKYRDLTVLSDTPILQADNERELDQAIENKILRSSVVLIMAGVYSIHGHWINKEIEVAQRLGKPIIAIKPFGPERISSVVRKAANAECAWNTVNIVRTIRLYG
ncbi:TIR domain-containing protein [Pseudomonas fontis]|uniref:TIR domain-containing protein n=1 Tax=Pseudomonas fontis TaxID=2942633 RepID=A0ABT5NWR4_9PSED|nr:TIR domain-containing protein [Pseudomonas fontis]MDD0974286.1 TIR domain-containing protein [Pseudomonas fontis]MDD0992627.1 TIR domain-containing protein [Pseudomonas fontis]